MSTDLPRASLMLAVLLATACTSTSSRAPAATPTAQESCALGCLTNSPGTTRYPYPADAGRISPLPVPEKFDGELARKSNNINPGVRTATIVVTIPAGKVVASDVICQGRGELVITSMPTSQAQQRISCDGNAIPSQQGAVANAPETQSKRFVFEVRATGPARWLVAISARTGQ